MFRLRPCLLIYAFEGARRYRVSNVGLDRAVLLRNGLLTVPLAGLLVTRRSGCGCIQRSLRIRRHHGTIATLNRHGRLPAIYGVRLPVRVLCGFIVRRQLIQPKHRLARLNAVAWLISVVGVLLDRSVYTFAGWDWRPISAGIQVDASRGWDIDSDFDKRSAASFSA